ncbi:MAG: hypothetical protein BKP49_00400 [Treponema sp. CETP13]|nr:MAG: hypothetical protein BKP49_00400 [Treponema sp. CETP13]
MIEEKEKKIGPVVTYLIKGILYQEEKPELWNTLITYENSIQEYFKVIGLAVQIHKSNGYAYLMTIENDATQRVLPRLITRRSLSYPVSLILVLLRRKILEFETSSSEERLILDKEEIIDMVSAFFPSGSNEVKFYKKIDAYLQKINDLGFIRFLSDKKDKIEVKRVIEAFVDAQWISDFNTKLAEYKAYKSNDLKITIVDEDTEESVH